MNSSDQQSSGSSGKGGGGKKDDGKNASGNSGSGRSGGGGSSKGPGDSVALSQLNGPSQVQQEAKLRELGNRGPRSQFDISERLENLLNNIYKHLGRPGAAGDGTLQAALK